MKNICGIDIVLKSGKVYAVKYITAHTIVNIKNNIKTINGRYLKNRSVRNSPAIDLPA